MYININHSHHHTLAHSVHQVSRPASVLYVNGLCYCSSVFPNSLKMHFTVFTAVLGSMKVHKNENLCCYIVGACCCCFFISNTELFMCY